MSLVSATAAALSLVLALYVWTTVALLRQNGRLLLRVDALEAKLGRTGPEPRGMRRDANLPPAFKEGDRVPSLQLIDLDGQVLDLSALRGRNTVLLFWDPDDGKCARMLPDLKTVERLGLADVPELLLVASGSAKANRAPGLRSRVLLDPHLAGRAMFGVDYIPTAVLIDKDGRVASGLGAGYVPAFETIGIVPFVPTEHPTVDAMLTLAGVRGDDVVYDLGCGDGRVVVAAANTYGAHGVGVDINPERIAEARANAKKASVDHLVRFEERQLCDVDLQDATVVSMYLLPSVVMQLRPMLMALTPGTRVVSHGFDMGDWKPDRQIVSNGDTLYLWTIPDQSRRP